MKPRAGLYTEERYREGLDRWRDFVWKICSRVYGPFIIAGFAVLFVERQEISWLAGAATGAFIAGWIAFREMPPSYIEHWGEGTEGERNTEAALAPLEEAGWRIFHEVDAPYGNYDHIALGEAGLFLLDSKKLGGTIHVDEGKPTLRRRFYPDRPESLDWVRRRTLASAASLSEDVGRVGGGRAWVQAVAVIWSDFPEGVLEQGNCVFLHGSKLQAWLEARPPALTDVRVELLEAAVRALVHQNRNRALAN